MKVVFYASDKPREEQLADVFAEGVRKHGDTFERRRTADYGVDETGSERLFAGPGPDADVACCFGVKGRSREIIKDHRALNRATLLFDKGYTRQKGDGSIDGHTLYSRVCINGGSPARYMGRHKRPDDRWKRLDVRLGAPQSNRGGHILIATSSQKYADFHGLGDAQDYANGVISQLKKLCDNPLVYRPKPSFRGSEPINGTSFSGKESTIQEALRGAWCVVTHGASAAIDAVLNGVAAICLGDCAASPVCASAIEKVVAPSYPDARTLKQWCSDLAYTQWTADELRSGDAWLDIKTEILAQQ